MDIEFRVCPMCNGYGVRDSGVNCKECGGRGRGGLHGTGTIGSGEIMYDRDTGQRLTTKDLIDRMSLPEQ